MDAQSRFWAAVTGLSVEGPVEHRRLVGPTPGHTIWVNAVDRPHTVKNRLHLDVDAAHRDDVVALGATLLAPCEKTGYAWSVMADPEGNEFCVFERGRKVPAYRLHGIGVDCADADALAAWWGRVLGTRVVYDWGWCSLEGVAADDRMTIDFNVVPEPRTVPNRVHWDLTGDVDALLAAGATRLWDMPDWTVLADPEGNEFCVFPE
ncbi:MAG: hypothetical protein CMH83_13145 [Nocardioides sp.]|nr:hypothetical protein [Nocardioides sp.]